MKCQQFELYAAERGLSHGRIFPGTDAIQQFVDGLRDRWWWQRHYPNVKRVEVYPRPSTSSGSLGWYEPTKRAGAIEMLAEHWDELTVLHELAHVLAEARYESLSHDPWFARVYLELVYEVMGSGPYADLRAAFDAGGVNYDPPTDNFALHYD